MTNDAKPQIEYRNVSASSVKLADGDVLAGYIACFDSPSDEMYGYTEVIAPGCFTRTLSSGDDVVALVNHDIDAVIGRLSAKTLTLNEDSKGLAFSNFLPGTTRANDLKISVERGDVSGCSFGFVARKDQYVENKDGSVVRTLLDVDLIEVSVGVTFPAYSDPQCALRSLPSSMPVEIRSTLERRMKQTDSSVAPDETNDHESEWQLNAEMRLRLAAAQ